MEVTEKVKILLCVFRPPAGLRGSETRARVRGLPDTNRLVSGHEIGPDLPRGPFRGQNDCTGDEPDLGLPVRSTNGSSPVNAQGRAVSELAVMPRDAVSLSRDWFFPQAGALPF